jgi:hypothetical protein
MKSTLIDSKHRERYIREGAFNVKSSGSFAQKGVRIFHILSMVSAGNRLFVGPPANAPPDVSWPGGFSYGALMVRI